MVIKWILGCPAEVFRCLVCVFILGLPMRPTLSASQCQSVCWGSGTVNQKSKRVRCQISSYLNSDRSFWFRASVYNPYPLPAPKGGMNIQDTISQSTFRDASQQMEGTVKLHSATHTGLLLPPQIVHIPAFAMWYSAWKARWKVSSSYLSPNLACKVDFKCCPEASPAHSGYYHG